MYSSKILALIFFILHQYSYCQVLDDSLKDSKKKRHIYLSNKYFIEPVKVFGYYSAELRDSIDKGLSIDSTVAFLWQKKAEPLLKRGKIEIGMSYLDKAVLYHPKRWLEDL